MRMEPGLRSLLGDRSLLIAVAAEIEAKAVVAGLGMDLPSRVVPCQPLRLSPQVELLTTGVGKSCAAASVARALDPARHALVLSTGIAGTYAPTLLGQTVVATTSILADEGVATPTGFQDIGSLGFPPLPTGISIPVPDSVLQVLNAHADALGPIATVSTCSGTDELARALQERTGAIAEAMEGAAVGLVATRLGVPFGELRVISNTTGNRPQQVWRIKESLATLSRVIGTLLQHRDGPPVPSAPHR